MSAKQLVYKIEHSLTLPDGRILSAEVLKRVVPGRYCGLMEDCFPDYDDYGPYKHFLDGTEITYDTFESQLSACFGESFDFMLNADEIETLVEPDGSNYGD